MPNTNFSRYAVLFDMDGVLVDSELHWRAVGSGFLRQMLPQWDDRLQRTILGLSLYQVFDVLVTQHGLSVERGEFLERYQELARTIYCEKSKMIAGSLECLQQLRDAGFVMGLASSAPRAWMDLVLTQFSLADYFAVVVSSEEVEARVKPAPDVYRHAIAQLNKPAECCVAIEDTAKGLASAKEAGAYCIGLRNGFNAQQDFSLADRVCEDFESCSVELLQSIFSK